MTQIFIVFYKVQVFFGKLVKTQDFHLGLTHYSVMTCYDSVAFSRLNKLDI